MLQLSDIMNPLHLARESSSDDSSSEDEAGEGTRMVEEDANKVDFHFLKTGMQAKSGLSSSPFYVLSGKSSKEGLLITHNVFKFSNNNSSRDNKTWWYTTHHPLMRRIPLLQGLAAASLQRSKLGEQNLARIARSAMGALTYVSDSRGKVHIPPEK